MTLEERLDYVDYNFSLMNKPEETAFKSGARQAILALKDCVCPGALVDAYVNTLREFANH